MSLRDLPQRWKKVVSRVVDEGGSLRAGYAPQQCSLNPLLPNSKQILCFKCVSLICILKTLGRLSTFHINSLLITCFISVT